MVPKRAGTIQEAILKLRTIGLISTLAIGLLAGPLPAAAQQAGKVYRIGFLTTASPVKSFKLRLTAFRQGLKKLGYVEGKNIVIEERYAKGRRDRLPKLAAELVRLKPDVIVTHGGSTARVADQAAKEAGTAVPILTLFTSLSAPCWRTVNHDRMRQPAPTGRVSVFVHTNRRSRAARSSNFPSLLWTNGLSMLSLRVRAVAKVVKTFGQSHPPETLGEFRY